MGWKQFSAVWVEKGLSHSRLLHFHPFPLSSSLNPNRGRPHHSHQKLWNFAWPAAIALLHPTLLPVAVMGFCTKVAVIAGGPLVGKLIDLFPRVPAYNFLSICSSVISWDNNSSTHAHASLETSVLMRPWFIILVLAGAVERLSGLALGVAVERDWVVLIAGSSLFGILLSKYETATSLKFAAALMMWSLPVVVTNLVLELGFDSVTSKVDESGFPAMRFTSVASLSDRRFAPSLKPTNTITENQKERERGKERMFLRERERERQTGYEADHNISYKIFIQMTGVQRP
ncbi:hypothetical protein L2E82_40588 [Cichorium intybus]|uniref:Uncharacterized protein n=1 Tax=Cichorium intybus TaxID=13427 RepID=A0ACB9AL70_CICIN|nr:hypothetical protein L2E82_40588 [Cichorium intybus]